MVVLAAVMLGLGACSGDTSASDPQGGEVGGADVGFGADAAGATTADTGAGSQGGATGSDAAGGSGQGDVGVGPETPEGCLRELSEARWVLDATGPTAQLGSRAVFDGQAVWVVYMAPQSEAERRETVWAARVHCDGSTAVAPLRLSTSGERRALMPSVDVREGRLVVVWASENPGDNAHALHMRAFSREGVLEGELEGVLPVQSDAAGLERMIWEPDVALLPGGGFVVVGSGAADEAFRAVVQYYDASGAPQGSAYVMPDGPGVQHIRPSIAADALGNVFVSFVREENFDEGHVVHTRFGAGQTVPELVAPFAAHPTARPNTTGMLSKRGTPRGEGPRQDHIHWLAFHVATPGRYDIALKEGSSALPVASLLRFGAAGQAHYRPAVAAGAHGGALAWYRFPSSPLKNFVMLQGFSRAADGTLSQGEALTLNQEATAVTPHGPAIDGLGGNTFVVVWSEGTSSAQARIVGRFVQLKH